MLNTNMLKGKIIEKGKTISMLAGQLGINPSTFYRKMKNNSFTISETDSIAKALQLSLAEANIFF